MGKSGQQAKTQTKKTAKERAPPRRKNKTQQTARQRTSKAQVITLVVTLVRNQSSNKSKVTRSHRRPAPTPTSLRVTPCLKCGWLFSFLFFFHFFNFFIDFRYLQEFWALNPRLKNAMISRQSRTYLKPWLDTRFRKDSLRVLKGFYIGARVGSIRALRDVVN